MKKLHLLLVLLMLNVFCLFPGRGVNVYAQSVETLYEKIKDVNQRQMIDKLKAMFEKSNSVAKDKYKPVQITYNVILDNSKTAKQKPDTIILDNGKKMIIIPEEVSNNLEVKVDISNLDTTLLDPFNHAPIFKVINDHVFVNLGLPSGLYWAISNVGASKCYEYGDYFAWGEIEPKATYSPKNALYGNKKLIGNLYENEDVATQKWGKGVRMPTAEEYEELKSYCNLTWYEEYDKDNDNNVGGCTVIGPNHFCLFFPAGGHKHDAETFDANKWGSYWTSSPYPKMPGNAYTFVFSRDNLKRLFTYDVCERGYLVRPVAE